MASRSPKFTTTYSAILCFIAFSPIVAMASVHDLLPLYKLPKGLLPREIDSCCLSNKDDSFTMELGKHPCYVRFSVGEQQQLVFFDRKVKGKLGLGKVREVSGIMAKKFMVWVNVSGIDVDEENGMLEFHVGPFSQKFPAEDFQVIHNCSSDAAIRLPFSSLLQPAALG
ncbi:uncharacterized protein LOC127259456 [Andrographis paniculata]|uniref:uncharacterized protein LOC127259456 n=1 Tax=Andrographis paniculata TaxID=175694 RepID=UPI0021E6F5AC|nr:uncharacterized protein LOC127259456 [Andrographis paniculata]